MPKRKNADEDHGDEKDHDRQNDEKDHDRQKKPKGKKSTCLMQWCNGTRGNDMGSWTIRNMELEKKVKILERLGWTGKAKDNPVYGRLLKCRRWFYCKVHLHEHVSIRTGRPSSLANKTCFRRSADDFKARFDKDLKLFINEDDPIFNDTIPGRRLQWSEINCDVKDAVKRAEAAKQATIVANALLLLCEEKKPDPRVSSANAVG